MPVKQITDEIAYAQERIVKIDKAMLDAVKQKALATPRKRSRICAHKDPEDPLHEMFIVHTKDAYVRPHKQLNKSESFYVVEGAVTVVMFDEEGDIIEAIEMGEARSGKPFYYRTSEAIFHAIIITSDVLVFHEVTKGPFVKSDTIYACWAPEESEVEKVKKFRDELNLNVRKRQKV